MHEFSTMQQIIETVINEIQNHKKAPITKLVLDIGELTFLGEEQLQFSFNLLKEDTLLEKASLEINTIKTKGRCTCGYEGDVNYKYKEDFHLAFPVLACPICSQHLEITEGRECLIKHIEIEVDDVPSP